MLYPPGYTDPTYRRTPSPDGRYVAIVASHNRWLDLYNEVWIAPTQEQDPEKWHRLTPWADGSLWVEWLSPRQLVIHDVSERGHGFMPDLYQAWRDVEIEVRCRPWAPPWPEGTIEVPSPEGRFVVVLAHQTAAEALYRSAWIRTGNFREIASAVPGGHPKTVSRVGLWLYADCGYSAYNHDRPSSRGRPNPLRRDPGSPARPGG